MKIKVNYYDVETDRAVEKACHSFEHQAHSNQFVFMPLDEPPTIFKSVVIMSPDVNISYEEGGSGVCVYVKGWQSMKRGGYGRTNTTVRITDE